MEVLPLSQRDPRWGNKLLGFSKLKIKDYGCTLTSLTCLINYLYKTDYTPDQVNEYLKRANAFSGPLIVWSRVPVAFSKLKFIWRGYNYDNAKVSFYVYLKKMPVMVEVNAAKIGAVKHWVLFLGSKKMMDPWTGAIEPTSKYPLTGYSLFDKS